MLTVTKDPPAIDLNLADSAVARFGSSDSSTLVFTGAQNPRLLNPASTCKVEHHLRLEERIFCHPDTGKDVQPWSAPAREIS